jgi:hypothetical protein
MDIGPLPSFGAVRYMPTSIARVADALNEYSSGVGGLASVENKPERASPEKSSDVDQHPISAESGLAERNAWRVPPFRAARRRCPGIPFALRRTTLRRGWKGAHMAGGGAPFGAPPA